MRHYMFMMFRSSRFLKTIILFSVFIFPLFSAIAKELVNPAGALIYHYPEDQGNYSITIQTQAPPPPVSFTQKLMQSQFRVKRIISSEEFKVSSKAKHIGDRLSQQLREQFNFSINLKTSDWLLSVKAAVAQVEPRVRAVFNNSLLMESQAEDWKSGWFSGWYPIEIKMVKEHWAPKRVEGSVQAHIIEEEAEVYKTALDMVNQVSDRSAQAVSQNTAEFKQLVSESVPFSVVDIPLKTPEWIDRKKFYEQNVTQAVREVLETKYARHELGAVYENTSVSEDAGQSGILYQFKSPEGEFLDKNQELYSKIRSSNPYHEQGRIGRELSLIAVETADEEFAEGRKETAGLAYQVGEAVSDIALGVTPYVGLGKDVYEALTGRHLLTGRDLSNFERSMSVVGIAVSGATGGMISSGSLKASLDTTGKVLSKIHAKALEKGSAFAQRGFETIARSSHRVLDSLQGVGVQTRKGIKSAGHFLRRAFAKENPSVEEIAGTIQSVGRSGIEDYTKALDKLSSVHLPRAGEEFLARNVRHSKLLKGKPFSQAELVRTGKTYTEFYQNMDTVNPVAVSEKVWRGLLKSGRDKSGRVFVNNPEDVFRLPAGVKEGRYSLPGERVIYTSLSKKTAVREILENHPNVPAKDFDKLFHLQSKNIEVDKVLDLTQRSTRQLFKVGEKAGKRALTEADIATKFADDSSVYQYTQIIGDIAQKKGFKAIKIPSAPAFEEGGKNIISFVELTK